MLVIGVAIIMENYLNKKNKTLLLSIISGECGSNDEKLFKEEESIRMINVLYWTNKMNEWFILCQLLFPPLMDIYI